MVEATRRVWSFRFLYVASCAAIMFFHLLPLQTSPGRWGAPDFLSALTYAWVLRRPEYVPALLIAAMMLLADMLFMRPPGLQAALVVAGLNSCVGACNSPVSCLLALNGRWWRASWSRSPSRNAWPLQLPWSSAHLWG